MSTLFKAASAAELSNRRSQPKKLLDPELLVACRHLGAIVLYIVGCFLNIKFHNYFGFIPFAAYFLWFFSIKKERIFCEY